jgi:hypothetical protein
MWFECEMFPKVSVQSLIPGGVFREGALGTWLYHLSTDALLSQWTREMMDTVEGGAWLKDISCWRTALKSISWPMPLPLSLPPVHHEVTHFITCHSFLPKRMECRGLKAKEPSDHGLKPLKHNQNKCSSCFLMCFVTTTRNYTPLNPSHLPFILSLILNHLDTYPEKLQSLWMFFVKGNLKSDDYWL